MGRNNDKRRVGTLGQIKAERRQLRWCCERTGCSRTVDADLEALIAKCGAAFPLQSALALARCTKCSARWPLVDCQAVPIMVPRTEVYVGFTAEYLRTSGDAAAATLRPAALFCGWPTYSTAGKAHE